MGINMIGIESEHLLIAVECIVQFALVQQDVAEIAMGIAMVGIERKDLLQTGTCLIQPALTPQQRGEIVVRIDMIRIERNGISTATQGRLEAAASLRRAVELRPDYVAAHRTLAAVLRSLGDTDAAEASLRRALSIEPEAVQILYDLATVLQ